MICLVCNKQFESGTECPRCGFPVINSTDPEEVKTRYADLIKACRVRFLETIDVYVLHYLWKDGGNGTIVKDKTVPVHLGNGKELYKNEVFEETKLARVTGLDSIDVSLKITAGSETAEKTVSIPNIPNPELQQLGIALHYDFSCELILKAESGRESHSKSFRLFE